MGPCPTCSPPSNCSCGAAVSLLLDEHRGYLADAVRLRALERAIAEAVRPGDTVLDLASGTGILGLLACRAGASRVYSVDRGAIIGAARDLARDNGFDDRITFIRAHSLHVALPSKVDVIVGDQLGPIGLEAGLIEYFADARDRFLSPGGRIIPGSVDVLIAPLESETLHHRVAFWSTRPAGFDTAPLARLAANDTSAVDLSPRDFLGEPVTLVSLELASVRPGLIRGSTVARIAREGQLHGLGGWFSARLSPGSSMTNSPLAADRIDRRQAFFPLGRAVPVGEGDEVRIEMKMLPSASVFTWQVEVGPAGGPARESFTNSTWRGMLLSDEDVDRASPASVPVLDARAQAWQSVLNLCDGRRTVAEVERALLDAHPDLFPSARRAASFVAEVLARCAD